MRTLVTPQSTAPVGLVEAHWWLVDSGTWANLSNCARAIIVPIFRKTAGWNKDSEQLSLSWLAQAGSIERARVPAALRELQQLGIIAVEKANPRGRSSTIRLTLAVAQRRSRPHLSMQTRLDSLVPPEHHRAEPDSAQEAPPAVQGSAQQASEVVLSEHRDGAPRAPNKGSFPNESKSEKRRRPLNVVPPPPHSQSPQASWLDEPLQLLHDSGPISSPLPPVRAKWLACQIDAARQSAGLDETTTLKWLQWAAAITAQRTPEDPWAYLLGVLKSGLEERGGLGLPEHLVPGTDGNATHFQTKYEHIYR